MQQVNRYHDEWLVQFDLFPPEPIGYKNENIINLFSQLFLVYSS